MLTKQWNKLKNQDFWKSEAGEVGIKGIAVTVAVIVIIGFAILAIKAVVPNWVDEVWQKFMDLIDGLAG